MRNLRSGRPSPRQSPLSLLSMLVSLPLALLLLLSTCRANSQPIACTDDVQPCPDGVTYVGRDPSNDCEFRPCPFPANRADADEDDNNSTVGVAILPVDEDDEEGTMMACAKDLKECTFIDEENATVAYTSVSRDPNNNCTFYDCPPPKSPPEVPVLVDDGDMMACTADAKACTLTDENGTETVYTYVSRNPMENCTFYECPSPKPPPMDIDGDENMVDSLPITGDEDGSEIYQSTMANFSEVMHDNTTNTNMTDPDGKNVDLDDDERIRDDAPSAIATGSSGSSNENESTILEIAIFNTFTTLVQAVEAAGFSDALNGTALGFITVFAPTDEAFMKLPSGTLESLLLPENLPQLSNLLLYHIVPGNASSTFLAGGGQVPTLLSDDDPTSNTLLVSPADANGNIKVNDAFIVAEDVPASNGLIHAIDAVLIPDDSTSSPTATPAPTSTDSPTGAPDEPATGEELCIATGGSVEDQTCCGTATDFPNLCTDNVCPCPGGGNEEDRKVCVCPEGSCFHDLAGCITDETSAKLDLCTTTGGTVAFTSCCDATDNMPATCGIVGPCGCPPTDSSPRLVCDCEANDCFSDSMGCVAETDMPTPLEDDEPTASPAASPSLSSAPTTSSVPTAEAPPTGSNISIDELIANNTWVPVGTNRTKVRRSPGITNRQGISIFSAVVSSGTNIRYIFDPNGPFSICYQTFASTSIELAFTCAAGLFRQEVLTARATSRIKAIVQEIQAAEEPDVIVLQDLVRLQQNATILSVLEVQDWFAGVESACACQADEMVLDMYEILRKELRRRCLIYQIFVHIDEAAALPAMVNTTAGLAGGFRITRRERFHITLVKKGVATMWERGRAIDYVNSEDLPVDAFRLQNSALSVDVKMNGAAYRVVNTQLSPVEGVHKEEAAELVEYLSRDGDEDSSAGFQTIVAGNIPPAAATILSEAGYVDTWLDNTNADEDPATEAYTGGTDIKIKERIRSLDKREDVIMVKDGSDRWQSNDDMQVSPWLRRFGRGGARGKILGRPRYWFSTNMCVYGELYPKMKNDNVFSRAEL